MYQHEKQQILEQLDDLGITFGPGITEPTDPRTDGIPYPLKPSHEITVLPKHDSPLYVMPVASDGASKRPDMQSAIAKGILDIVFGNGRWIN
jgi:hypothetical protein